MTTETKKFWRRRYYLHSKLKHLDVLDVRKRTITPKDSLTEKDWKYIHRLQKEYDYAIQQQLF